MPLVKGRTNRTVIHYFFNDTDTLFTSVQYCLLSAWTSVVGKAVTTVAKASTPVHNRFNIFFIILNAPFILGNKIAVHNERLEIEKERQFRRSILYEIFNFFLASILMCRTISLHI
ncbi:hypothetical protein QOO_2371 [Clostridioides difficile Y165]|nr:hypothetical protein QOO_2371 [Clostridioides difficile Y165]